MSAIEKMPLDELRSSLRRQLHSFDFGGGQLNDHHRLTCEAEYYARIGDLDEAQFRLRLRNRPKWSSEAECQAQYNEVMGLK